MGFPGGTSGKESAFKCRRHKTHGFDPWVGKIPWRRKWQPTPVFLPGKSHGQRSLVGYSPCGHRVGHDRTLNATWYVFYNQWCLIFKDMWTQSDVQLEYYTWLMPMLYWWLSISRFASGYYYHLFGWTWELVHSSLLGSPTDSTMPGASVRNPARDKVMRKEADIRKACSDFRDPSGNS